MTWLPLHCAFHLCWLQCVCFPDQDLVLKVAKALNDRRKSSYCFIVVRQGCNIQFHLSTQLTHSRPRYLLRHFFFSDCVSKSGFRWDKHLGLHTEESRWLSNVAGHQAIAWEPEWTKGRGGENLPSDWPMGLEHPFSVAVGAPGF